MVSAGVDVGAQTIKAVVLCDGKLAGSSVVMAGWEPIEAAKGALEQALARAGIARQDVKRIIATGVGRKSIPFADDYMTEVTCNARGAAWLIPTVRTVIDIGAEENRGIKCDSSGKVLDFAKNDKCAAGVGAFVEAMARALETTVEEMAQLSLKSDREIPVNVTCVIFAESEVVSLIHAQTPKADIARAIHDAIASRTISMVRRIGVEQDVTVVGGVARNVGVIDALKRHLGVDLVVPEEPQIVGALGAALLAAG